MIIPRWIIRFSAWVPRSRKLLLIVMTVAVCISLLMQYGSNITINVPNPSLDKKSVNVRQNGGIIINDESVHFIDLPKKNDKSTKRKVIERNINEWQKKILSIHEKFRPKTLPSCKNECAFDKAICDARTLDQWNRIITSPKLKAIPLFSNDSSIFPWEPEYLSQPPLQDVKLLPDLRLSKIHHVADDNSRNHNLLQNHIRCLKNERLTFRADLRNGYDHYRKLGGDDVRAWITNGGLNNYSLTGSVTDMRNGSYLVTVTPQWTGPVELNIAVVYPREYLRAALHHMKEGRHRFIYGLFSNRSAKVEEVTICHPTPNIPGRPCLCNFTTWNKRPYYCGKPLDSRLTCQDFAGVKPAPGPIAKDYTSAERTMAAGISRSMDLSTIHHSLVIQAEFNEKQPNPDPLPPCNKVKNYRTTWDRQSPRGMWENSKFWTSFECKEPPITSQWIRSCLNSTSIWMIGDSNLNKIYGSLRSYVKIFIAPTEIKSWPFERRGVSEKYNITTTFRGHEYPLFHYQTKGWVYLMIQGGVEDFLQKIPSTGSHVVILHYYLHFSISHLSAIFQRFLAVRQAVKDLFKRNPSVIVAIRGPHISSVEWGRNHLFGGDVQGMFILRLLNDVFENLKDKIVFLDGWDMTTSLKNQRMHPSPVVPRAMLRTLLAFKCGDL